MSDESKPRTLGYWLHKIVPWLVLAVLTIAGWLLYRELRQFSLARIREALGQIPPLQLWSCVALTAFSYLVLIGYDWLAVKSIDHPLPVRRVALASFVGFAMSYNFGALLGGGSIRYRFYSLWGLSGAEIVQLVTLLAVTFWFGVFALAGVVFVVQPFEIDQSWHIPVVDSRPLGWMLIASAALYLVATVVWRRPLHIRGKAARLPTVGLASAQLVVSALDFIVAAACFYVLLPRELNVEYMPMLAVYLLAVVVGVLTHVPGGAGVFELVMLKLAPAEAKNESLVAAIIMFRVIYFWLPLMLAVPIYALYEWRIRRRRRAAATPTINR